MEADVNETEIHHSRSQLDVYEDISNLRASDLKLRIEEMLRIKVFQVHGANLPSNRPIFKNI